MLHPGETPKAPYVTTLLMDRPGVAVAVTDYVKALPCSISKWIPQRLTCLGTDGFGRSESRAALRRHFEVDAQCIACAALADLARQGALAADLAAQARRDLGVDPDKPSPLAI
jgi:pyruvate dehydrogenase E1 component